MPMYSVKTDKSSKEALDKAVAFFKGTGLELKERDECCADFEGGGGHVSIRIVEGEERTINLETREWDYQVKRFMEEMS